jgi:hypothetical protein
MKRYKSKIVLFLLAIYLPMWLLSSFHVHAYPLKDAETTEEQHSSLMDEDGCLLCQFQQFAYEESPQVVVTVNLAETKVESNPMVQEVVSAFGQTFSSRAPPVLL